jgi:hypothetical protein
MNSVYEFTVFTSRFQADRTYRIAKTKSGWHISHIAINGDCKPDGSPFLYENFEQDGVHFPSGIDGFLENVWNRLTEGSINTEVAQQRLQQLADWVSECEKSQPKWKGWNV